MWREYLGDAVYVAIDERGQLCLTTENGIEATNTMFMEPEVLAALLDYMERRRTPAAGQQPRSGG